MVTFRGLMPEQLEPWVSDIFYNRYARIPKLYTQVLKVESDDKAFVDVFKVAGLGTFQLKPEGTPISYDDPVEGDRIRVIHSTYGLGFRVTKEMVEDEQHGIIKKMPMDLSDSAIDHQETLAAGPFNTAFVATSFTGLDGLALCTTNHPNLKTGTLQSNELTPGVALSNTGIEALLTQIELTTNESDRPIALNPTKLLIHPSQKWEAERLLESEREPHTADNQINVIKSSRTGLTPFPYRYMTDTDDYFIICAEHSVTWYDRVKLETDSGVDFATKDMLYDARYRASVCFWDWRGVNGSQV